MMSSFAKVPIPLGCAWLVASRQENLQFCLDSYGYSFRYKGRRYGGKILHLKFYAGGARQTNEFLLIDTLVSDSRFPRELNRFGDVYLSLLKTLVLRGQNAVQFLDQSLEPFMVLLLRNHRAKFVDSVTFSFIHGDRGSITGFTVCRMFDAER
ncbi:MAG: hypothetical protein WBC78_13725 [Candidatus Sulfotelmatobacter sp.]